MIIYKFLNPASANLDDLVVVKAEIDEISEKAAEDKISRLKKLKREAEILSTKISGELLSDEIVDSSNTLDQDLKNFESIFGIVSNFKSKEVCFVLLQL